MKFAAFIMTYKRPETAQITITKLFEQTRTPDKVLIIDNDPDQSGKMLFNNLSDFPLEYYPMNYNSGPAGAAAKGLELLADQGYDWIAWIDDDDPPVFNDSFEVLLKTAQHNPKCGSVGAVGQTVNLKTGIINIMPDDCLKGEGALEVNTIAGGMLKMVNGNMLRQYCILPDKDLFFGFEDLDLDLKIRKAGYKLLVPKDLFRRHREHFRDFKKNVINKNKKDVNKIWRTYYSIRSLLYIFIYHRLYSAFILTFFRYGFKIFSSFKYGFKYGFSNLKFTFKAFYHFLINKKGLICS